VGSTRENLQRFLKERYVPQTPAIVCYNLATALFWKQNLLILGNLTLVLSTDYPGHKLKSLAHFTTK